MTYLVDVGPLQPVRAVTPQDAFALALLCLGRSQDEISADHPAAVYELSADGASLLRRIPVQTSAREEVAA